MGKGKVLVTGVSGIIGSHLARYLLEQGYEVHGAARFSGVKSRQKGQVKDLEGSDLVRWKKDLAYDPLDDMPDDFDYLFHEAALWGARDETPEEKNAVYEISSLMCGRLMYRWRKAQAMVLASTGGLHPASHEPWDEKAPVAPGGSYHTGKFAMEQVGLFCSVQFNIPMVILRYFWPSANFEELARECVTTVLQGMPIEDNIEDPYVWTPLDISDSCYYTLRSVEAASVPPKVLVCSGPEVVSRKELCEIAGEILGKKPVLKDAPVSRWRSLADSSQLYGLFGKPRKHITEVVRRVAQETKAQGLQKL